MRLISLLGASLLACSAVSAAAQTFGPPIPGLCLLSRSGAVGASRAGQSLQIQLGQMRGSLTGQLAQQRATLEQQRRQLEARQSTIAPIEYQQQQARLNQQLQAVDQQQNARFITAQTRGQQQADQALNAALSRVITRTACSLVMERQHSYGWNNAMDITAAVTREMDMILAAVSIN